jgi:hypothetical protein
MSPAVNRHGAVLSKCRPTGKIPDFAAIAAAIAKCGDIVYWHRGNSVEDMQLDNPHRHLERSDSNDGSSWPAKTVARYLAAWPTRVSTMGPNRRAKHRETR